MVEIGHELIRSEVIFTPAKLERVEYIATTYGCPKCKETEEPQFVKDNGIPALLRGSYVSPSLAAHVICQKFMNAMPLYRQEKDWEQLGATITRASMARWIIHCSKTYFQPIYEYFEKQRKENPESQTAKECIECQVAGTFYRTPKEKKRAESLGYKENLYLEPEPENPYDNNAIKIETYDGFHIGYIPSYLCEDVLAFIEKYPDYKVTVEEVKEGSSSPFIDIKITY